jgi:hypothetical protein
MARGILTTNVIEQQRTPVNNSEGLPAQLGADSWILSGGYGRGGLVVTPRTPVMPVAPEAQGVIGERKTNDNSKTPVTQGTLRAATCPTKPAAISELLLIDFAKSEAAIQESPGRSPGNCH